MKNTPSQEYIKRICDLYGDVYDDREEDSSPGGLDWQPGVKANHLSLSAFQRTLDQEYNIKLSTAKIRKILISGGCWTTERSREVQELYEKYGSVRDVAEELDVSDVFGEPTIFDKEGQKYVRTGRLVNEDIDEIEAVNAMRIHIHRDGIFVPIKILRAMDCPGVVQLLYREQDKRFGIRTLKKKEENSLEIPGDVYSGKWRGIQITDRELISTVYRIIGKTEDYVGEPVFFEKGCILALDEVVKSDYSVDPEKFMKVL